MGACARPLQLGIDVLGGKGEPGTEGRHVHLGDAIGKDDLTGDAVAIEHLHALVVVPGAGERLLPALAPLHVDVCDQKFLCRRACP